MNTNMTYCRYMSSRCSRKAWQDVLAMVCPFGGSVVLVCFPVSLRGARHTDTFTRLSYICSTALDLPIVGCFVPGWHKKLTHHLRYLTTQELTLRSDTIINSWIPLATQELLLVLI